MKSRVSDKTKRQVFKEIMAEIGSKGGKAAAKSLGPDGVRARALKASKAAKKAAAERRVKKEKGK